jgi:outer membrane biosynthesis protein TonB
VIDTIMALWNLMFHRNAGRDEIWNERRPKVIPVMLALLLVCISTSLLLVTAGVWWPALQHGQHPDGGNRAGNRIGLPTMTVQSTIPATPTTAATVMPVITSTSTTPTCLGTPTMTGSHTIPPSPTDSQGQGGNQPGTPVPTVTTPTPQSTPPIVIVRPIVHITPTATPSPTETPSPTPIPTQTDTPTPAPTPTDTPTATATPPMTPIPPTDTPSPGPGSPTATSTATASPTASPTGTGGTEIPGNREAAGTGDQHNGNTLTPDCLNNNLEIDNNEAVLSALEEYFWIIMSCSIVGTVAFCGGIYRLRQRRLRR